MRKTQNLLPLWAGLLIFVAQNCSATVAKSTFGFLAERYRTSDSTDTPASIHKLQKQTQHDPANAPAWLALAHAYYDQDVLDKALQALKQVQALNQTSDSAMILQAKIFYEQQKSAKAANLFKAIKNNSSFIGQAHFYLGLLQTQAKDYPKAIQYYEQALKTMPVHAQCWNNLGMAFLLQGNHDRARLALEKAIELNPRLSEAYLNIAMLYDMLERPVDAVAAYQQAIQTMPDSIPKGFMPMFVQAIQARQEGDTPKAIRLFRTVIQFDPGFLNPYWDLAMLYMQDQYYGSAAEILKKAIKVDSTVVMFHVGLGLVYVGIRNYDKAEHIFQSTLERTPKAIAAMIGLATVHMAKHNWKKAQAVLEKALTEQPRNQLAVVTMGELYFITQQFPKGIDLLNAFANGLSKIPTELAALLGALYAAQGDTAAAHRIAKPIDPNTLRSPKSHYWLGQYYLLTGNYEAAAFSFSRSYSIKTDFLEAYLSSARAYKQANNLKAAMSELESALDMDSSLAEAHYRIGEIYSELEQFDSSAYFLNRSLMLEPEQNRALIAKAYNFAKQGLLDSAEIRFKQALEQSVFRHEAFAGLGHVAMLEGQYKKAIRYLKKAIKQAPSLPASYINLHKIYMRQSKWKKGVEIIEKGKKKNNPFPEADKLIADAYYKAHRFDKAACYYSKAFEASPHDNILRFARAVCLFYDKGFAACSTEIQALLEDTTYFMEVIRFRAQAQMMEDRNEASIKDYEWIVKVDNDDLDSRNNLAWLYTKAPTRERLARARELTQECMDRDPRNAQFADTYAQIMWVMGEKVKAMEYLERAISLNPKDEKFWNQRQKELSR